MYTKQNYQMWTGSLCLAPFVIASILIFSIVALGLGTGYGVQLAKAPLDSYKLEHPTAHPGIHHWSNAYFVFYSATMPFVSILQAGLDLALYACGHLIPMYALTGSLVCLCGWAVQAGFWTQCDLPANLETAIEGQCYQSYVQKDPINGDLVGVSTMLTNSKVGFGFVVLVTYIAYTAFAAAAVHKQRTQHKIPRTQAKDLASEGESMQL